MIANDISHCQGCIFILLYIPHVYPKYACKKLLIMLFSKKYYVRTSDKVRRDDMPTISISKEIETNGYADCRNITSDVQEAVKTSGITSGIVTVFIPGSTAGVTTIEFEEGVVNDLSVALERLIPKDINYKHNERWHDGNGFSHVRAAFVGPSLTVPFMEGRLQLGTWQQIVLLDFDNRKRLRRYLISIMGEK